MKTIRQTQSEQAATEYNRREEEHRQMRQEARESHQYFLVSFRWANTLIAAFLVLLALYGLVVLHCHNGWLWLGAAVESVTAWQGWYYYRRQKQQQSQ